MDLAIQLLFQYKGMSHFKGRLPFIAYNERNWTEIVNFCAPIAVQKTKKGQAEGRAIIDLPTGNEAFEYGMILVRLGKQRILLLQAQEFEELFEIDSNNDGREYH